MGRTVAAGLCYTSRPQDDSGAFLTLVSVRAGGRVIGVALAGAFCFFCLYEGGSVLYSICAEG